MIKIASSRESKGATKSIANSFVSTLKESGQWATLTLRHLISQSYDMESTYLATQLEVRCDSYPSRLVGAQISGNVKRILMMMVASHFDLLRVMSLNATEF